MDKKRRQEPQRWFKREGEGFLQQGQSRKARIESAAARGWLKERQLLRQNVWYEEEADFQEDSERPEQQN
jgi:hypothetical protein